VLGGEDPRTFSGTQNAASRQWDGTEVLSFATTTTACIRGNDGANWRSAGRDSLICCSFVFLVLNVLIPFV